MIQKIDYNLIRNDLETGDLVFFSGTGLVSEAIKMGTGSEWSHVGMCIKIDILDLVLLWESTTLSDVEDMMTNKMVKGVQIVPLSKRLEKYDGYYGFRRLGIPAKYSDYKKVLKQLRRELDGKPYEESELQLVRSAFEFSDRFSCAPDLSSVFCSELVAEYLKRLGVLPKNKPSLTYSPADLANYDFF